MIGGHVCPKGVTLIYHLYLAKLNSNIRQNMDNFIKTFMKPPPLSQAQIEEEISTFIKNFKAPGPTFSPVPICSIAMDVYENLFTDNDGKVPGAKVYYENGVLYLLDDLSYLHGKILNLVTDSILINNIYSEAYFTRMSYTIKADAIVFEPDLALSIEPEHFSGVLLQNDVIPPSLIVEVAVSQRYSAAIAKCKVYYRAFKIPVSIIISSRNLFKHRKLTIMYSELGKVTRELEVPIDEDFTLHIPMALLTENMLPESRRVLLLNQSDKLTLYLKSQRLVSLIP